MPIIRVGTDNCKACSLRVNQNQGRVIKNWINTESEIACLGLGGGATEQEQCRPFVGDAGQRLRDALRKAGVNDNNISYLNAVLCWPPSNKIDASMYEPCRHHFKESIEQMPNLKLVIVLGADAYKFLTGEKPTMKSVYLKQINIPEYPDILFLPVYHPSYSLRQPTPDNIKLFYDGIKNSITILQAKKKLTKKKKIFVVRSKEQLYKILDILKTKSVLSFDTETTSLKFYKAKLICFGFSYELLTAIVFPYMIPDGDILKYYWEEPEREAIKKFMREIFNDKTKSIVAQNGKYDSLICSKIFGTGIANLKFDSMLASYTLDSNQSFDLDSLVVREIPEHAGYKANFWSKVSESDKEDGSWIFKVDYEDVLEYNGIDCFCTLEISQTLAKRL
jgi:uracil-DNA glycosylase family 4